MSDEPRPVRAKLNQSPERQVFSDLSEEYFLWMDQQISRLCGFSIPDIVKMDLNEYVAFTVGIGCNIDEDEGGVYFIRTLDGDVAAMGGIRRLPSGASEIVRIYTRPQFRGMGYGARMVQGLVATARQLGYREIYLDTGIFMESAQKIYEASGFAACAPYPGAEPPEELKPYWLYMKRSL